MRSEPEVNRAIAQYADLVFHLCMVYLKNKADAEDAFQTVFLKYTLSKQHFQSDEHEKAWLIRVTSTTCRDQLRSFFRKYTVPLEEVPLFEPQESDEHQAVLDALWSLPKDYREVVYLHYYEGYTAPEIGEILHKKTNSIYTHLSRAKQMLKDILGGENDAG